MDCSTIHDKLAEYIEGTLLPVEKKKVEEHLATCELCRAGAAELKKTMDTLKGLDDIAPPPWLTEKVMQKIRAEAEPKKSIFRKLFFPLHIKLPLEAFATLLIAGAAVLIMKSMGSDPRTVTTVTEKPLVQTLPPEKELLPKDYPADIPAAGKAEQVPAPAVRPKAEAEPSPGQPRVTDQQPIPAHPMPAAPAPPAPVARSFEAGKALDSAERDETRQKSAPGSAQSVVSAEKKSLDILTVTVQVRDPEKASGEIEAALSKLGGSISSIEKREASTAIAIHLDAQKFDMFMEQVRRIGILKETQPAPEAPTNNKLLLIIIKQ